MPDPTQSNELNSEPLNFQPGVVVQAIQRAKWLLIDEVNRADIDKAFGELFTLFSGRSVHLPFKERSKGKFLDIVLGGEDYPGEEARWIKIPPSWRMIGTMNTFDKASLFQLSCCVLCDALLLSKFLYRPGKPI